MVPAAAQSDRKSIVAASGLNIDASQRQYLVHESVMNAVLMHYSSNCLAVHKMLVNKPTVGIKHP